MAGLGAKDIMRNITALEQLIEEINFQRAKEMRQCLMSKDSDTSFVIVHGTTYWTDLFVRHFLFQTDRSTDADDLLFFIRKKQVRGSRYIPKYQTEVEVYRKDSRKLPIGDPDIDWEETVYLNLIIHQFDYTLTLAVCTRTSPKELQVLKRHSQKVYASPSRRRMDSKGEVEEITYPNVCFHVDNFDEVFADMLVRDGEMVCVELVAADHGGSRQAVIFLGSIRYDALKRVYDTRASLSSKVAQRMMLGLFSGGANQRIEFVRMKGPQGKGHAEMAVTKPKGSGVETPTSEPGVCLTDLWDSDWEDEPEDRFMYRHQRRLSDPSANFNTFINSGWVSKAEGKSRSENEGLDNFANGLYEIESGDVRDAVCSCRCCSVIACRSYEDEDRGILVQGVCTKCDHFHGPKEAIKAVERSSEKKRNDHQLMSEGSQIEVDGPSPEQQESENASLKSFSKKDFNLVLGIEAAEAFELKDTLNNQELCSLKPELKGGTETVKAVIECEADDSDSPGEAEPFLLHETELTKRKSYPDSSSLPDVEICSKKKLNKQQSLRSKRSPGSAVRVNSANSGRRNSTNKDYVAVPTSEGDVVVNQPITDNILCKRLIIGPNLGSFLDSRTHPSEQPKYRKSVSLDPKKVEEHFRRTSSLSNLTKSISLDNVANFKKALKKQISMPCRVTKDGTRVYFPCDLSRFHSIFL